MSLKHERLHADLTESVKRAQECHRGLEIIMARVSGGGYSPHARKAMKSLDDALNRTEGQMCLRSKKKHAVTGSVATPRYTESSSIDPATPSVPVKKEQFRSQLHQFNHRLALIKTGKVHPDFSKDEALTRILDTTVSVMTSTSVSNNTYDSEVRPLPHVSCVNGRTQSPLKLPSFEEYCERNDKKGTTLKPYFKKVEERIGGLDRMKRRLQGLDLLLSANHPWDGDCDLLERLERHPNQRDAILTSKHAFSHHRKSVVLHRSQPRPLTSPKDAELSISIQSKAFETAKKTQEKRLEDILQRLIIEKPFQLRQKSKLFDVDKLAEAHSIAIFKDLRREIESKRGERVKHARAQAQIYTEMLRFLQRRSEPTEMQLQCLGVVRRLLEEGWVLTVEMCARIERELGEEVRELVNVVRKAIS